MAGEGGGGFERELISHEQNRTEVYIYDKR